MATTATPYGLRAVNLIGGQPYAGSTRAVKIASGYTEGLYNGTIVALHTDGTLIMVGTTGGTGGDVFIAGTLGVFVGCQYTDATLGFVSAQNWPDGQVAADAVGFVIDDPDVVFMAQADGAVTQTDLGNNCFLANAQTTSTGSTATGNSNVAIANATAATTAIAFRIVDFVESTTSTVGDDYTDLLIKFNPGSHSYTRNDGI
jgi:hypothetical protein